MSSAHFASDGSQTIPKLEQELANAEQELCRFETNVASESEFVAMVGFTPTSKKISHVSTSTFQQACRLVGKARARLRCQEIVNTLDKPQAINALNAERNKVEDQVVILFQRYRLEGAKFERTESSRQRNSILPGESLVYSSSFLRPF